MHRRCVSQTWAGAQPRPQPICPHTQTLDAWTYVHAASIIIYYHYKKCGDHTVTLSWITLQWHFTELEIQTKRNKVQPDKVNVIPLSVKNVMCSAGSVKTEVMTHTWRLVGDFSNLQCNNNNNNNNNNNTKFIKRHNAFWRLQTFRPRKACNCNYMDYYSFTDPGR